MSTESPAREVPVGTVMVDQRNVQWTCRLIHGTRGPLFTPSHITTDVATWAMSSQDELFQQGFVLTAVA